MRELRGERSVDDPVEVEVRLVDATGVPHQHDVRALARRQLVDEAYALPLRPAVGEIGDQDEQLHRGRILAETLAGQRFATTKSIAPVSFSTSAGSIAGYIAIRSWLRPSLR